MNDVYVGFEDAKKFFFEAMIHGYVSGVQPQENTPFPGFKCHRFGDGPLSLIDMWHTTPDSNNSTGMTTIFVSEIPIWVMHYGGQYPEEAIETLKLALAWNYERKDFMGGRGPENFPSGKFIYENHPKGSFLEFEGHEYISHSSTMKGAGEHWYRGGWLIRQHRIALF